MQGVCVRVPCECVCLKEVGMNVFRIPGIMCMCVCIAKEAEIFSVWKWEFAANWCTSLLSPVIFFPQWNPNQSKIILTAPEQKKGKKFHSQQKLQRMIISALNILCCLNTQFKFCCSNDISKLILHCQDWAAAGNEACSLQVTEVSGTNVTSKRVTAPFVCSTLCRLGSCTTKNSQDRCFPRRRNFIFF